MLLVYKRKGRDAMYQALYRKYRPKTFSDVVGQLHVTETLKNEVKLGRIGHAYLFIGSRGTGKTTCAKIFSRAVNCSNNTVTGDPCGECEMCHSIEDTEVMDIVELDAASNNGVNDIREICESAAFMPAKAKYRVYIIDEVHMLSIGAFNALLKTLEEPPAHVVFILATTEVHKVPATILSRCQRFEFHRISPQDIADRLLYVAKCEGIILEKEAAFLIARISDGAMRDALSILDKCINDGDAVTFDVVTKTVGVATKENIYNLSKAIVEKSSEDALKIIGKLSDESKDMARLCDELIGYFRDLMLVKVTSSDHGLISVSKEEYSAINEVSDKIEICEIINILDTLETAAERISKGCNSRIELELAIVKLCVPGVDYSAESIAVRLGKLENIVKSGFTTDVKRVNAYKKKEPEPNLSNQGNSAEASGVQDQKQDFEKKTPNIVKTSTNNLQDEAKEMPNWPDVIEVLKKHSRTMAMAFKGSKAYVNGDFVLIDSKNDVAFELLRKSAQRDRMRMAIKEVTGRAYKLGPYKKNNEETKKDPLDDFLQMARDAGIQVEEN